MRWSPPRSGGGKVIHPGAGSTRDGCLLAHPLPAGDAVSAAGTSILPPEPSKRRRSAVLLAAVHVTGGWHAGDARPTSSAIELTSEKGSGFVEPTGIHQHQKLARIPAVTRQLNPRFRWNY